MIKKAVIIYGPPGSGKGTQAELLAKLYGFIHFDTGRYVENILRAPGWNKNAVLRRERKLFDNGKLMTPSFVLKIVAEATERIAKAGLNIVYSGSPRTLYEAFGENENGLIKVLEKNYGKKNIKIVKLNIGEGTTLKRNSQRLVCSLCGLPVLAKVKIKSCSFCDAPLRTRTLDKPEIIKKRLVEYKTRTYPIIAGLRKRGFKVIGSNGEPAPHLVYNSLIKALRFK